MNLIRNTTWLGFPETVNEKAARAVAAGVVLLVLVTELTHSWIPIAFLLYGFVARVASGPKLSPLGQVATRLVSPRLGEPRMVSGRPKRFAQAIGAAFSTTVMLLILAGERSAGFDLLWILGSFALLEASLGLCVGCKIFAIAQRLGIVADICEECGDIFSDAAKARRLTTN